MQRFLLLGLALLASACGSSSNEGGKFAAAYCPEVAKCCSKLGFQGGDGQMCRFVLSAAPSNASTDACLAEMRAQVAAGTFCAADGPSPACNAAFSSSSTGNKKPGEDCDVDSDCASSSDGKVICQSLYLDSSNWLHKCQVQIPGKVGDACIGTQEGDVFSSTSTTTRTDIPARGYVCNTADGIKCWSDTCVALADVGAVCNYSSDCVRTAYCDGKDRCSPRVLAGGPCTGTVSTAECAVGYYCPAASPRYCTAQLGTGASCSSPDMCKSGNCLEGKCNPDMLETIGWGLMCS
jgi:hypothetical protein